MALPWRQDDAALARGVPTAIDDPNTSAPELLRQLQGELLLEWKHTGERIQVMTDRLHTHARQSAQARQLMRPTHFHCGILPSRLTLEPIVQAL